MFVAKNLNWVTCLIFYILPKHPSWGPYCLQHKWLCQAKAHAFGRHCFCFDRLATAHTSGSTDKSQTLAKTRQLPSTESTGHSWARWKIFQPFFSWDSSLPIMILSIYISLAHISCVLGPCGMDLLLLFCLKICPFTISFNLFCFCLSKCNSINN